MARTAKKVQVRDVLSQQIVDSEYMTAKRNQDVAYSHLESLIGMLECQRNEKDYDWMSDYFFPIMNSIFHAERGMEASQYFPSRDLVDIKLNGDSPQDKLHGEAAKKCINSTLNRRDLYYYQKFIRHRSLNSLFGSAYKLCRWEYADKTENLNAVDPKGKKKEITRKRIIKDQFNFDVIDPRNVYTDNNYAYSIQEKDWVIIRYESSYEELKSNVNAGFINLDKVKDALKKKDKTKTESATAKESYNKDTDSQFISDTAVGRFDVIDRYGMAWAVVKEIDEKEGFPTKAEPGIDENGNIQENAELIETIITFALVNNERIMVRFIPTVFIDANGNPYKPIIRSLCYVHPTKDGGLGDGQHMREMQIVLNDNENMAADRTKLSLLPTFIGQESAIEDRLDDIRFEPEHINLVPDINTSLKELKIDGNTTSAQLQSQKIVGAMYQVMGVWPSSGMGALPDKASTTATAVAGAEASKNVRLGYKSMTYENTDLTEFYWMILNMTWRFAKTATAIKLWGNVATQLGAEWAITDYSFTPVSSNIEAEYNKFKKAQHLDQAIGRLAGLAKGVPQAIPLIAYMTGQEINYLVGDDDPNIKKMIAAFAKGKFSEGGDQPDQPANMKDAPTSNQHGMPVSEMESQAREGANA